MRTAARVGLLAPLTVFLLVCFAAPLAWLLSLAVRDGEVVRALPRTTAALAGWSAPAAPPVGVWPAFAQDLVQARADGVLADAARRLNYAVNGVRSPLMRAAREATEPPEGTVFDAAFFAAVDPLLGSTDFLAAVTQAAGPVSPFYLLGAADLQRTPAGGVVRVPEDQRIYMDVLGRTLGIAGTVTLICLLLGFPVAVLMTRVEGPKADALMVLVMLPFWTSLLVRTAAWVVLLQREGLVNAALLNIGLIGQPLDMIYNRVGVLVAMSHVLLPFMILPLYNVLRDIPPGYLRASMSLGAPPATGFFRVYLPLAAPGIAAGALMVFILALGYYITPALVGGGGDQMVAYFIAKYTTETGNWGLASALGLVLLVVTVALFHLAHRMSGGRVLASG